MNHPASHDQSPAERQVNLRDARNHLARLVDAVHRGASVVITKHGRPWVRLVPLAAASPRQRRPGRWGMASPSLDSTALFAVPDRLTVLQRLQRQRRLEGFGPLGRDA
jgi:prevent-host-death family protein